MKSFRSAAARTSSSVAGRPADLSSTGWRNLDNSPTSRDTTGDLSSSTGWGSAWDSSSSTGWGTAGDSSSSTGWGAAGDSSSSSSTGWRQDVFAPAAIPSKPRYVKNWFQQPLTVKIAQPGENFFEYMRWRKEKLQEKLRTGSYLQAVDQGEKELRSFHQATESRKASALNWQLTSKALVYEWKVDMHGTIVSCQQARDLWYDYPPWFRRFEPLLNQWDLCNRWPYPAQFRVSAEKSLDYVLDVDDPDNDWEDYNSLHPEEQQYRDIFIRSGRGPLIRADDLIDHRPLSPPLFHATSLPPSPPGGAHVLLPPVLNAAPLLLQPPNVLPPPTPEGSRAPSPDGSTTSSPAPIDMDTLSDGEIMDQEEEGMSALPVFTGE
jgi:hypothetical protein